jgi:hypothetical protein
MAAGFVFIILAPIWINCMILGRTSYEKDYKNGTITKDKINKRGYNKFLEINGNVEVEINYEKIKNDERWDGLKGYITNTTLRNWWRYKCFCYTKLTLQYGN